MRRLLLLPLLAVTFTGCITSGHGRYHSRSYHRSHHHHSTAGAIFGLIGLAADIAIAVSHSREHEPPPPVVGVYNMPPPPPPPRVAPPIAPPPPQHVAPPSAPRSSAPPPPEPNELALAQMIDDEDPGERAR